jgi:hypothetical protein
MREQGIATGKLVRSAGIYPLIPEMGAVIDASRELL